MGISRLFAAFILVLLALPTGSAGGSDAPGRIVDTPTAGSLSRKQYLLESQLFDGGGMVQRALFGLNDYINIGLSYGGSNIIGSERVSWQPHIGFQVRVRIIEESLRGPALSLGFDTQGDGPYLRGDNLNRFRHKSRGAYLVLSRNYRFFGDLGLHGGVNYSLESDDDIDPSFWAGFDKSLGRRIDFCCEYDLASNEGRSHSISADRGHINAAVKWHFGKGFGLEFNLRNLLRTEQMEDNGRLVRHPQPSRELRFAYTGLF